MDAAFPRSTHWMGLPARWLDQEQLNTVVTKLERDKLCEC
jgi:hypothetical protein